MQKLETPIKLFVAAYYRKSPASKSAIEASISRQQKEAREFAAKNGWVIFEEYTDGGKSGSKDQALRTEFARMISDSAKGEWSAVLVWHTNRFARLDSIDIADAGGIAELRRNGCHIESVSQGRIDPATKQGRMALFMSAESDSDFSLEISAKSLSGRLTAIAAGYWPHGTVPFGYDCQYIFGDETVIKPRLDRANRPKGAKLRLVVNEKEAKVLRFMFAEFADKDISLRQLGKKLALMNIPTPKGGSRGWNKDTIRDVLRQRAFIGDVAIGCHRRSNRQAFNRAEKTIKQNACPVIIDRQQWEIVQAKLNQNQSFNRHPRSDKSSSLSGVLICGHCGYRMEKKQRNGETYYTCSSAFKRPELGCHQWRVQEAALLPELTKLLVDSIDFQLLFSLQAKPPVDAAKDLTALKSEGERLAKQIAKGTDNLLKADSDIFPMLQSRLAEWKAEAAKIENTIRLAEDPAPAAASYAEWYEKIRPSLVNVKPGKEFPLTRRPDGSQTFNPLELLKCMPVNTTPDQLRSLLHRLKCSCTLWWKPNGSRNYTLERGLIKAEFIAGGENSLAVGSNTTSQRVIRIEKAITFAVGFGTFQAGMKKGFKRGPWSDERKESYRETARQLIGKRKRSKDGKVLPAVA
jgi:site-specific DNA recombinase